MVVTRHTTSWGGGEFSIDYGQVRVQSIVYRSIVLQRVTRLLADVDRLETLHTKYNTIYA